jgi:inhibitor of cysteine peptidase
MEKKLLILFVALQAVLFGREVVVKDSDNGTTVELEVKDTLRIELQGNPTTGFTWEEQSPPTAILQETQHSYVSSGNLVGAGGTYKFTFKAISVGSTQISFIYYRLWEGDIPPEKRFVITVITHPVENSDSSSFR